MPIKNPYLKVSASYSFGMMLYYLLHVFYFKRADPSWLNNAYFITFYLPTIAGLICTPETNKETTYRHFLATSFIILIFFDFITMITGSNFIEVKRWVSAAIMLGLPLAFSALFLKLSTEKTKSS